MSIRDCLRLKLETRKNGLPFSGVKTCDENEESLSDLLTVEVDRRQNTYKGVSFPTGNQGERCLLELLVDREGH